MADDDITLTLPDPITVRFADTKRPRTFKSFQEVRKWAEEELERLKSLEPQKVRGELQSIINSYQQHVRSISTFARSGIEEKNATQRHTHSEQIRKHLRSYEKQPILYFGSPLGKKLLSLFEAEPNLVAAMMRFRWAPQNPPNELWHVTVHAATRLALMEEGIESTARAEKEAIADLKAKLEADFEAMAARFKRAILTEARNALKTSRMRRRQQKEVASQMYEHGAKLLDIEAHFKERMALEIPSEYWSKKAGQHKTGFWISAGVFSLVVIGGAALAIQLGPYLVSLIKQDVGTSVLTSLVVISVPILAYFWVLRLVSRFLNVNLARWQDAQERSVMMQTYLALLEKEQNAMDQPERLLILHALFRPGPGDTPEDAPPPNLLDIINRVIKPGGTH